MTTTPQTSPKQGTVTKRQIPDEEQQACCRLHQILASGNSNKRLKTGDIMLSPVSTDAVVANKMQSNENDDSVGARQITEKGTFNSSSPSPLKNFEICIEEGGDEMDRCGDENNNTTFFDIDSSQMTITHEKMPATSSSAKTESRPRTYTDENRNLGNNHTPACASINVAAESSINTNFLPNSEALSSHPASPIDLTTPKELRMDGGRQRRSLSSRNQSDSGDSQIASIQEDDRDITVRTDRAVAADDCIDLTTPTPQKATADSNTPNIRMRLLCLSDTKNGEEDLDDSDDDDDDLQITDDDLRGAGMQHANEQEIIAIGSPMARDSGHLNAQQHNTTSENASPDSETPEQRLAREQAESEALARQLMEEEAMESYARHTEYLQQHSNQFSEEDLEAIRAAMEENGANHADEMAEEQAEMLGDSYDSNDLSYETLLRLGERMGSVKQERWTLEASKHIAKCPTYKFDPDILVGTKDENDSTVKCLVCQHPYESGEEVRQLPCQHVFHSECVDQWLATNDCCPYCRQCIVAVAKTPADKEVVTLDNA